MASAAPQLFNNIRLGTRSGSIPGTLRLTPSGLTWRSSVGGRTIEAPAAEVQGASWSRDSVGFGLDVTRSDGDPLLFSGFKEADLAAFRSALPHVDVSERPRATSGHNWGSVAVSGGAVQFFVGGRPAFSLPLHDVGSAQLGRDEVLLEVAADDVAADDRADALAEISFFVPKENPDWAQARDDDGAKKEEGVEGKEDGAAAAPAVPAAKALFEAVNAHVDVEGGAGEPLATFGGVAIIVPRGRFDVEMHGTHLKLLGAAQDFRVSYDAILRIFVLPKVNASLTLVAASLDPPIRKGATFYPHVLFQFPSHEELEVTLNASDELVEAKNKKNGGKLERSLRGPSADVFARVLRGLSGARLTRPGSFRDAEGRGAAVRCSYKADDGYLYPLERAFFYVQKPPILVPYEDVDAVEFLRPAQGITAAKTFDLAVRLRGSGAEHLFRGIPRAEWTNLFEFIRAKHLRIENFKEAQAGPGAAAGGYAGFGGLDAEPDDDEDDDDFKAGDEDEEEDEDEDDSEDDLVDEEEEEREEKRRRAREGADEQDDGDDLVVGGDDDDDGGEGAADGEGGAKPASRKKAPARRATGDGDEAVAGPAKKRRKKKDKDAPKRGLSAFMFYSNENREAVRAANPTAAFGEIGRILGQQWKELSAEDKAPYEQRSLEDRERYEREKKVYVAAKADAATAAAAEADEAGDEPADEDDA